MSLNKILGQSAFWQVNKHLARHFKCNDTALLLSDLIGKQAYFEKEGQLTPDGFFFNTSDNIETDTNISYHKQKKYLKQLSDIGFIETKLKGIPAKLHFKVIESKILNFLNTGIEEIQKLDDEKFETNNNKGNENKEKIIKDNKSSKKHLFRDSIYFNNLYKFTLDLHKRNPESKKADISYYYNTVLNWSDSNSNKRIDWLATSDNFIRGDIAKSKLVKTNKPQQKHSSDIYGVL